MWSSDHESYREDDPILWHEINFRVTWKASGPILILSQMMTSEDTLIETNDKRSASICSLSWRCLLVVAIRLQLFSGSSWLPHEEPSLPENSSRTAIRGWHHQEEMMSFIYDDVVRNTFPSFTQKLKASYYAAFDVRSLLRMILMSYFWCRSLMNWNWSSILITFSFFTCFWEQIHSSLSLSLSLPFLR